jgi:hypothetical protein
VVIHDECCSDAKDLAYVEGIVAEHKRGVPGVNLHCAMHSYRVSPKFGDKSIAPGSEGAMWFDYLGLQSSHHGAQLPIAVTFLPANHPITKGMTDWTTINEELYNNVNVFPSATPLAKGKQGAGDNPGENDNVVVWTNLYGEKKTRVFSTTLGHNNDTVADAKYLDLVTRGGGGRERVASERPLRGAERQTPNAERQTLNASWARLNASVIAHAPVRRLALSVWRLAFSRPQGRHAVSEDFLRLPQRIRQQKIHNRLRVFQAMRMMIHPRLHNHLDLPAERLVTLLEDRRIFRVRHRRVRIADHGDDRHMRLGERFELVERVAFESCRRFLGEPENLQRLRPAIRVALARAFAAGPTANIEHRRVEI